MIGYEEKDILKKIKLIKNKKILLDNIIMQKIFDCKTNKFFTIHNKRGIPTEIEYEFIDGIFK